MPKLVHIVIGKSCGSYGDNELRIPWFGGELHNLSGRCFWLVLVHVADEEHRTQSDPCGVHEVRVFDNVLCFFCEGSHFFILLERIKNLDKFYSYRWSQ